MSNNPKKQEASSEAVDGKFTENWARNWLCGDVFANLSR
jgi:hypothetical protein